MTVHKSKGLGFDVVILPDLQGNSVDGRRGGLSVHRDQDHVVDWVLDMPAQNVAELDDVLLGQMEAERADSAYEAICRLYVALTRAKQALYVMVEPVSPRSRSRNFPKLLHAALGDEWAQGDVRWFESGQGPALAGEKLRSMDLGPGEDLSRLNRRLRLQARTPSDGGRQALTAGAWFSSGSGSRAEWGTEVHRLLATIEWCASGEDSARREDWLANGADPTVIEAVVRLLAQPALASVFQPSQTTAIEEVWREQTFEVVHDGAWITGVIDRVVVERDAEGHPRKAIVYDFKTDDLTESGLSEGVMRHREQLLLYRDVVARLTGLAPAQVGAAVVWVRLGRLSEVT